MGSRIAAMIIVLATVALLAWVALGRDGSETATIAAAGADSTVADTAPQTTSSNNADAVEPATADAATSAVETERDDTAEITEPAPTAIPEPAIPEPENYGPRMDLVELDGWLNTDATSIDDFNGQVVLVEMWTFGCHNCKARIPHNQSYYEEFGDQNFEIIGVHAPEFSYEAEIANIENALVDLGVTWPQALDTNKLNFRAWQPGTTNFWPRTYIIDQNGDIRYDHIGEGKYEEARETVRYLLENPPEPRVTS